MAVKLIISDVDGTLVGREEILTEEVRTLKSLLDTRSLNFTIASGRSYEKIANFARHIGIELPIVVGNGIGLVKSGQVLWRQDFLAQIIKDAVLLADEMGMSVIFNNGLNDYVYRMNDWVIRAVKRTGDTYHELDRENFNWQTERFHKIMIVDNEKPGRVDAVADLLRQQEKGINVIHYDSRFIDIAPAGCCKGEAVKKLAHYLGIDMQEILAIGDDKNDIEMLKNAGIGIAVGNAVESVKEAADYVCSNSEIKGVIEAIAKFTN